MAQPPPENRAYSQSENIEINTSLAILEALRRVDIPAAIAAARLGAALAGGADSNCSQREGCSCERCQHNPATFLHGTDQIPLNLPHVIARDSSSFAMNPLRLNSETLLQLAAMYPGSMPEGWTSTLDRQTPMITETWTVANPDPSISSSQTIGFEATAETAGLPNANLAQEAPDNVEAEGSSTLAVEKRCQQQGCTNPIEGRRSFCVDHSVGGKRCRVQTCLKIPVGALGRCIAHGGGKRCKQPRCPKSAIGNTGFCFADGGGHRCKRLGCPKSAQGRSGLCFAHGGGKQCQTEGCVKAARGSTLHCIGHGGGKRCQTEGCTKLVDGNTGYCSNHGRTNPIAGVTKPARDSLVSKGPR
mmetsp:Transcript_46339/g.88456  ORF Transcript_46339/g.88456 Transcript_46339/m.88456 type:complete len:359 (+) Transcript_46339:76-1152(+)